MPRRWPLASPVLALSARRRNALLDRSAELMATTPESRRRTRRVFRPRPYTLIHPASTNTRSSCRAPSLRPSRSAAPNRLSWKSDRPRTPTMPFAPIGGRASVIAGRPSARPRPRSAAVRRLSMRSLCASRRLAVVDQLAVMLEQIRSLRDLAPPWLERSVWTLVSSVNGPRTRPPVRRPLALASPNRRTSRGHA
jgi:hypothetical protein